MQPAEVSSDLSSGFGRWIVETFLPGLWEKMEKMSAYELEMWHIVLRKCAHFAEYFMLGVLWISVLRAVVCKYQKLVTIGLCILTASVDEVIQRFVPGRSGQFQDVLLDSIGAMFGVCLIWCVIKLRRACMKNVNMIK